MDVSSNEVKYSSEVRISIVTVTYGDRWHYLCELLNLADSASLISDVVVVDNASQPSLATRIKSSVFCKTYVVRSPVNMGSAQGFKIGIETAIKRGAEYILLLDDDNLPYENALDSLICSYVNFQSILSLDEFALLSFRPDHQADMAAGVALHRCFPRPGSFFGFHLMDVPYKIWRRMPWGRPRPPKFFPSYVLVPYAPYSGLFFHRSVVDRIGLPDIEMVLYADDTEFTSRLTRIGGQIFLIPSSRIYDQETSWNIKSRFSSSFIGWLCGNGDIRAFYGARNQAYLEIKNNDHKFMRSVNKICYMFILFIVAIITRRVGRLQLLIYAISQGETSKLGYHERYPLP